MVVEIYKLHLPLAKARRAARTTNRNIFNSESEKTKRALYTCEDGKIYRNLKCFKISSSGLQQLGFV